MGDHRFSFKATFEMHGVKDDINLAWCNWGGGSNGIDPRIVEWIQNTLDRSMAKYNKQCAEYFAEQNKVEIEAEERIELERLKRKYEV